MTGFDMKKIFLAKLFPDNIWEKPKNFRPNDQEVFEILRNGPPSLGRVNKNGTFTPVIIVAPPLLRRACKSKNTFENYIWRAWPLLHPL